jgi:carboxylesterase
MNAKAWKILRRAGKCLALLGLLAVLTLCCLSCAWRHEFYHGGTSAPQDPQTGVMRGAEPILLENGNRRACLMLHGWMTSPADFGDLPGELARAGWDVHAPHLAGHCTHPRDLVGISADQLLERARGHYGALRSRYDRVALLGFSVGGTVAALLAEEEPPDGLVLVAPFLGVRHKWYYVLPARWWHALLSPVVPYVGRSKSLVRINRKEGLERLVSYTVFPTKADDALFELRRRALEDCEADTLDVPALLVWAPGDEVASPGASRQFFARLPGQANKTLSCPRSNHHILNDHDRQEAIRAIAEFLDAQWPPPAAGFPY